MDRLTDFAVYRKARALGVFWDAVVHRAPTPPLQPEDAELAVEKARLILQAVRSAAPEPLSDPEPHS